MKYYWAMWNPSKQPSLLLEELEMMARRALDVEYLQVNLDPSARQTMVFYTTPEQAYLFQFQLHSRRLRLTPSTSADFIRDARPVTPAKKARLQHGEGVTASPVVADVPNASWKCSAVLCVDLEPGDITQSWVQRDGGIVPTQNSIQLRLLDEIVYVNDKDPWSTRNCLWLSFKFAAAQANHSSAVPLPATSVPLPLSPAVPLEPAVEANHFVQSDLAVPAVQNGSVLFYLAVTQNFHSRVMGENEKVMRARHFSSVSSMCGTDGIPLSASPSQALETLYLHRKVFHNRSMQWNVDSCSLGEACLHHEGCQGTVPHRDRCASVIYMIKAPSDLVSALLAGGHLLTCKANKLDLSILVTELDLNGESFKVWIADTPGWLNVRHTVRLADWTAQDLEEKLAGAQSEVLRLESARERLKAHLQAEASSRQRRRADQP